MSIANSETLPGRVVHVIAQLRGGAGRYVVDTAVEQRRRAPGSVCVVVSADAEGAWHSSADLLEELAAHGIPVHCCGDFFKRHPVGLRAAASSLSALGLFGQPDVVAHAHTAMAAIVARWAGAPVVVATCHGWNLTRPAAFDVQDAVALSLADRVVAFSAHWSRLLQERLAVTDVHIIPYGLDLQRTPSLPDRRETNRPPRVVSVGEITARMGPDLLLQAMARVWAELPEAELHFIGDGDAAEQTRALARSLDPSGQRVTFHSASEPPYPRLGNFDVFARASRSDDQPAAVIDAMLAGLPIVGTRVGGIGDLVEGARCGIIVPPDAPRKLAAALTVLLTTGHDARCELGGDGERFARLTFDIRRHVSALQGLYDGGEPAGASVQADGGRPFRAEGPVRLHLGCGPDRREGWVNVDARPGVNPDIVASVDALPMFEDGTVDTIEACHLFEHLPVHEARRALTEWFRLLKSGGALLLELPNFEACVRMIGAHRDEHGHDLGMIGLFGWPVCVEADGVAQVHKWGWTPDSLTGALREAGFADVQQEPVTQTWRPAARVDRDFRLRAVKSVH